MPLNENDLGEMDKTILFRTMDEMFTDSDDLQDDDVSIESVFGLWTDREVTRESLREKAWAKLVVQARNQAVIGRRMPVVDMLILRVTSLAHYQKNLRILRS